MLADPRVMRFYPKAYSRDESLGWVLRQIDRYRDCGHGLWLAELRGTDEPVGQIGLIRQHVEEGVEDEIGYLLGSAFWGRGLATEGALGTRDWAFRSGPRERVVSLIRPENLPSQNVARRVGLTPGRKTLWGGLEHIVFSLERERWEEIQKGSPTGEEGASEP
jgi:RimJ/RimL family protein N-acetyltransferase